MVNEILIESRKKKEKNRFYRLCHKNLPNKASMSDISKRPTTIKADKII